MSNNLRYVITHNCSQRFIKAINAGQLTWAHESKEAAHWCHDCRLEAFESLPMRLMKVTHIMQIDHGDHKHYWCHGCEQDGA